MLVCSFIVRIYDQLDAVWIGECTDIANRVRLAALDLAEYAAHDLAAASLRQVGHDLDGLRRGDRADRAAQHRDDALAQVGLGLLVVERQHHEQHHREALDVVGHADRGRLDYAALLLRGQLEFGRGEVVARGNYDVVDAAGDPDVAVRVALCAVPGELIPRRRLELDFVEAGRVAPDPARLPRPARFETQLALHVIARQLLVRVDVQNRDSDARHRLHRAARFVLLDLG